MKQIKVWCVVSMVIVGLVSVGVLGAACSRAYAQGDYGAGTETPAGVKQVAGDTVGGLTGDAHLAYAVAITIGIACLSAGYAVGKVGAAALGAAAERPEIMGRALIFVGLAEGIAIYGLIIAIMLVGRL